MGDRRRSHAPDGRITRFVVLALGLLGFVVLPAGPVPAGPGIGVRTGTAQPPPAHQAPGRGRGGATAVATSSPVAPRPAISTSQVRPALAQAGPRAVVPADAPDGPVAAAPRALAGRHPLAVQGRGPPAPTGL